MQDDDDFSALWADMAAEEFFDEILEKEVQKKVKELRKKHFNEELEATE